MSIQAVAWAMKQETGSPTLKLVLIAVANYADEKGRCWPSQERLAADTEITDRSIREALKKLEAAGLLTRTHRQTNGNKRQTDIIQLVFSHRKMTTLPPEDISGGPPEDDDIATGSSRHEPPEAGSGKPSLEPSIGESSLLGAVAPKAEVIPFPKAESKSRSRGARIPADWKPTPALLQIAYDEGFTHEAALRELANFHDYWLAASGHTAVKLDWTAAARVWLRKATSRFQNPRGSSSSGHGTPSGGRFGAMQRALARVAHSDPLSE